MTEYIVSYESKGFGWTTKRVEANRKDDAVEIATSPHVNKYGTDSIIEIDVYTDAEWAEHKNKGMSIAEFVDAINEA